jgi:sigma-B regulation protein RsbU (phosphoserine phosphatase)
VTLSRILVVDDEPGMIRSVERVLRHEYEVASSRSPRDAIGLAEAFKPALAILDVQMPDMDGFELMERLQAIDPELKVIFMTGSTHELDAKLIRSIRKDAFYFLQKPFDREVLLTLVAKCLELKRLELENRKHLERIERELAEARAFQHALLPPQQAQLGGITVFARYLPCSELAGDFYDYAPVGPDQVTLLVADVSGHGASAAMLTGIVKSAFHSSSSEGYEPVRVVERVSNGIRAFGDRHFISLICVRIGKGTVEFVNAGHPPGILVQYESSTALLEATGPIISPALSKSSWQSHTISVQSKARLLLFSDGIIEAESDAGDYGLERLVRQVTGNTGRGDDLLDDILKSIRQFAAGRRIQDDLTLVAADVS